ncbi:ATP-dependent RNA helicase ddx18, partial [Bonamia ostreae]
VLLSATQTKKTKDLAKLSFKKTQFYVGVDDKETHSTRLGLEQGFVIVEPEKKFLLLYSFLRRNRRKKTIVFLSTCSSTRFFAELLNYIDIPVLELHGKLKQSKRTSTFFEFCNAKNGCLLATDVAARGLDVPEVDWIIQYDPPDDPKSYIHRVGRTARGLNGRGKALIFLQPTETKFLQMLSENKVPMKEFNFPKNKISDVQSQL